MRVFRWCLVLGTTCTTALTAQTPTSSVPLDSLFKRYVQITSPTDLPPESGCSRWSGSIGRFCIGLIELRRAEFTASVDHIDKARERWERVVDEQPKWAIAWYALGRVRLAADRAGMVGREGPLMQAGQNNETGATAVFVRALKVDPTFSPAVLALASTPVPWQDKSGLKNRVELLREHRRQLTPEALVGASLFELDAGSVDTAIALLKAALSSTAGEVPRGFAQITLARALYRIAKPKEGRTAYLAGAAESDSAGIAAYQDQISWVGDSVEMKTWAALSPARRSAWLASFWSSRDVKEGRKEGERLLEHFRRVNYSFEFYRMIQPASGQQEMLTDVDEMTYARFLNGSPPKAPAPYTLAGYAWARATVGAQSRRRAFNSQQAVLDDRGLVYIRHGAPTDFARAIPKDIILNGEIAYKRDGAPTIEIWKWDRPGPEKPLILYFMNKPFMGSVEPNVLVPTLLAEDPITRVNLCYLDPPLCPVTNDLLIEVTERISDLEIAHSRDLGMAMIKDAVTSDAFIRSFEKSIKASFEAHVLDLAQGGSPRLVVAFAMAGQDLVGETGDFSDDALYSIRIQLMAARKSDGLRVEMDNVRRIPMSHILRKGEFISMLTELPLPPGRWTATAVLTQADAKGAEYRGVKATIEDLSVPAWSMNLSLSDMVLGREDINLRWHSGPGGQQVAVNPLNTFPRGTSAKLYTQLSGVTPGENYDATIEIFEGRVAKGTPKLTLSFSEPANASRVELVRTLGLEQLDPGPYLVRLTIKADGRSVVTTGGLEILK